MEQQYVVGLLFTEYGSRVALIQKNRPDWQCGFFNGIGGKIEDGENPLTAMIREFCKKTGATVTEWEHFATVEKEGVFKTHFFRAQSNEHKLETKTDEEVLEIPVSNVLKVLVPIISNLPWLIEMARVYNRPQWPYVVPNLKGHCYGITRMGA